MLKPILTSLAICLMVTSAAQAQSTGGGHGHGNRGGAPSSSAPPASGAPAAPPSKTTPTNQVEIVGVVQAIDPQTERITIAYDAVEALSWPRGTMPFEVGKTDLLKGVTVGEKVRFTLDSQQISSIRPF